MLRRENRNTFDSNHSYENVDIFLLYTIVASTPASCPLYILYIYYIYISQTCSDQKTPSRLDIKNNDMEK